MSGSHARLTYRAWSTEEDDLMRSMYQKIGRAGMAKMLGRTDASVGARRSDLGIAPRPKPRVPVVQRFERFVQRDELTGCWMWSGAKDTDGYGMLLVDGKPRPAHRISWEIRNGEIPLGMHVLHRCDTPACANPDHMFLGTNKDNVDDKIRKGRWRVRC